MRNGIKQTGATVASWTLMAAVLWVGFSGVSFAADPKPKVAVSTTCVPCTPNTPNTPHTLTADVNLVQMQDGAPDPTVLGDGLWTYIEEHVPTPLGTTKGWLTVDGSNRSTPVPQDPSQTPPCCNYINGGTLLSTADVATVDYLNVCSLPINPAANSIRVVARVTVTNAQKGNPKTFLGRSISMANPCKQPS